MNPPLWGVVGGLLLGLGPWGHLIFHPDKAAAQAALVQAGPIQIQALGEPRLKLVPLIAPSPPPPPARPPGKDAHALSPVAWPRPLDHLIFHINKAAAQAALAEAGAIQVQALGELRISSYCKKAWACAI